MRSKWSVFAIVFAVLFGLGVALIPGRSAPERSPAETEVLNALAEAPLPAADSSDEIPAGHRLLYRVARNKAAEIYAKDKRISRHAAREKIASIDDGAIHAAVKAAKLSIEDLPRGDLASILQWIIDHQDLILAIAKLIVALLAII